MSPIRYFHLLGSLSSRKLRVALRILGAQKDAESRDAGLNVICVTEKLGQPLDVSIPARFFEVHNP
jgi:hypothetical protein